MRIPLISSAFPLALSVSFLRLPLHIENVVCVILCMVSRLRAASVCFRLM